MSRIYLSKFSTLGYALSCLCFNISKNVCSIFFAPLLSIWECKINSFFYSRNFFLKKVFNITFSLQSVRCSNGSAKVNLFFIPDNFFEKNFQSDFFILNDPLLKRECKGKPFFIPSNFVRTFFNFFCGFSVNGPFAFQTGVQNYALFPICIIFLKFFLIIS